MLNSFERIDDLQFEGLKIIQNPNMFCFGLDAVLLANFVESKKEAKVIDFCTGNAIIPILLSHKINSYKITGVEIQPEIADMAIRSVKLNNLEHKIEIINSDITKMKCDKFDIVTVNPPYIRKGAGLLNPNKHIQIARHEILINFEQVAMSASKCLNTGGRLYLVHRPSRLVDIIYTLRKYRLEPKEIKFIYPKKGENANMVLILSMKDGKEELKILPPFYVYDENNNYVADISSIKN